MADQIPTFSYRFGDLYDFRTDHDEKFRYFLRINYPNHKYLFSKNFRPHSTYLQDYGDYSLYQGKISNKNIIYVTPIKTSK